MEIAKEMGKPKEGKKRIQINVKGVAWGACESVPYPLNTLKLSV